MSFLDTIGKGIDSVANTANNITAPGKLDARGAADLVVTIEAIKRGDPDAKLTRAEIKALAEINANKVAEMKKLFDAEAETGEPKYSHENGEEAKARKAYWEGYKAKLDAAIASYQTGLEKITIGTKEDLDALKKAHSAMLGLKGGTEVSATNPEIKKTPQQILDALIKSEYFKKTGLDGVINPNGSIQLNKGKNFPKNDTYTLYDVKTNPDGATVETKQPFDISKENILFNPATSDIKIKTVGETIQIEEYIKKDGKDVLNGKVVISPFQPVAGGAPTKPDTLVQKSSKEKMDNLLSIKGLKPDKTTTSNNGVQILQGKANGKEWSVTIDDSKETQTPLNAYIGGKQIAADGSIDTSSSRVGIFITFAAFEKAIQENLVPKSVGMAQSQSDTTEAPVKKSADQAHGKTAPKPTESRVPSRVIVPGTERPTTQQESEIRALLGAVKSEPNDPQIKNALVKARSSGNNTDLVALAQILHINIDKKILPQKLASTINEGIDKSNKVFEIKKQQETKDLADFKKQEAEILGKLGKKVQTGVFEVIDKNFTFNNKTYYKLINNEWNFSYRSNPDYPKNSHVSWKPAAEAFDAGGKLIPKTGYNLSKSEPMLQDLVKLNAKAKEKNYTLVDTI